MEKFDHNNQIEIEKIPDIESFLKLLKREPDFNGALSVQCMHSLQTSNNIILDSFMNDNLLSLLDELENSSSIGFLRRISRGEAWWKIHNPNVETQSSVLLCDLERLKIRLTEELDDISGNPLHKWNITKENCKENYEFFLKVEHTLVRNIKLTEHLSVVDYNQSKSDIYNRYSKERMLGGIDLLKDLANKLKIILCDRDIDKIDKNVFTKGDVYEFLGWLERSEFNDTSSKSSLFKSGFEILINKFCEQREYKLFPEIMRRNLDNHNVDRTVFAVGDDEPDPDCGYKCIFDKDGWVIYHCERGVRSKDSWFKSPNYATKQMLYLANMNNPEFKYPKIEFLFYI
jgi:hypothetical protein